MTLFNPTLFAESTITLLVIMDPPGSIPVFLSLVGRKTPAARTRAATKDYYDLVYVLQHNRAGGPEQAARRLLNGEFAADLNSLRTTFLEVRERYVRTADSGPAGYARQALEVQPEVGEAELRADAVDVVQRFFAELAQR